MENLLEKICNNKKIEVLENKKKYSYKTLEKLLNTTKLKRDFKSKILKAQNNKENFIIGEIKKNSPSAGNIINDYYPEELAVIYEKSGIGAISVLTDKNYFGGELDHLSLVKKTTNLPILRKDFIIDEYQILESKIYGADAILLIVAILKDEELNKFIKIAEEFNLDVIVETHNENEIERAIDIGYPIIGINNRNLKNLSIDTNNSAKLVKKINKNFTIIAESGIKKNQDIKMYNELNIYNFLIGETILKSEDREKIIKELLND
tara:strand:+ start:574 stop:1365 length:792 start_codon:yes stop_codon:yes gene_type:complete